MENNSNQTTIASLTHAQEKTTHISSKEKQKYLQEVYGLKLSSQQTNLIELNEDGQHDLTFADLVDEDIVHKQNSSPIPKATNTKDNDSDISLLIADISKKTFECPEEILEFMQSSCNCTKGHIYSIALSDQENSSDSSIEYYRVLCQEVNCTFFICLQFDPKTKSCLVKEEMKISHNHKLQSSNSNSLLNDNLPIKLEGTTQPNALKIDQSELSKLKKHQTLVECAPFKKRIFSHASSALPNLCQPGSSSGTPTQVLMYSSIEGSSFDQNLAVNPCLIPESSSIISPPKGTNYFPQSTTPSEPIDLILKKRVKEIKETFKQIHDSQKASCAEEVLQLLRKRAKDFPIKQMDSFNSLSGSSTPNLGGIYPIGQFSGVQNSTCGTTSDCEDGLFDTSLDFPSFSISERKRKQVGTYRCRICRREGHNSRSCDASKQSQAKNSFLNQGQQMMGSGITEDCAQLLHHSSIDTDDSAANSVSVVVGDRSSSATSMSMGLPTSSLMINESLAYDDEIIRDSLLLHQNNLIDNEMIIVNVGGKKQN